MNTPLTGGCLCGGVRYVYTGEPLGLVYCHCKDCQRCTGGPFAAIALIYRESLSILHGHLRSFTVTGEDGARVFREFCPTCGSPLLSGLERSRKIVGLKAGSLDDSTRLKPVMHIWTDSAVAWLAIQDELPRVPRNPPCKVIADQRDVRLRARCSSGLAPIHRLNALLKAVASS